MEFFRTISIFSGVFLYLSSQAQDDEEKFTAIAERAKTDPAAAVSMLREDETLDSHSLYLAFKDLKFETHLRFLNRIVQDENLANRFAFDSTTLIATFDSANKKPKNPEADNLKRDDLARLMIEQRNENVASMLKAVPEEIPEILVIPALWQLIRIH